MNERSNDPFLLEQRSQLTLSNLYEYDTMFRHNSTKSGFIKNDYGPETNKVLWTYNTTNSNTGNGVYSSAAIVGDTVFIGSGKGNLFALNLNNGSLLWNYSTIPGSWSHGQSVSPGFGNNTVFIGNDFIPQLWAINATTGKKVWNFSTGGGAMDGIYSAPVVVNGRVYFGTNNNKIFCLPATDPNNDSILKMSEIYWKFDAPDSVWSSPAVVNQRVYIGVGDANSADANKLYCLYANNGTIDWTYPQAGSIPDILSSPAVVNNKVYFGSKDNNVYALYANNGTLIWNYTTGDDIWGSPAVAYNRVFIGSKDDKLYALDANTGDKIWEYATGGDILSSPTVVDKKVYVGSSDGKVYSLNATAGTALKIWEYSISAYGNGICSSPSIKNGKLVIGGVDSSTPKIYCFADLDIIPPMITATSPSNLAEDVPTTTTITATFSEPMDDSTIDIASFIVKNSTGGSVTGTVNYISASSTAVFTPSSLLERGEIYTGTILTSVRDKVGLGLDGNKNGLNDGSPLDDFSWGFTTSLNKVPVLSDAVLTPLEGDLQTLFTFNVTYTDLDNDTPEQVPAFLRIFIDGELTGRALVPDPSAVPLLRDGNFSNGERYGYSMQFLSYGLHTYQFKCSDGIDVNSTQVFSNPKVWFKQVLEDITGLTAVEDVDLVVDLRDKITDEDSILSTLVISENSSYAVISDLNITFNYPNSFNYPGGRDLEIVEISILDPVSSYQITRDIKVNVTAVNDAPVISGLSNFTINLDEEYKLNVTPYISDVDNPVGELAITSNSSYSTVTGKEITYLYPGGSQVRKEIVNISVYDGELYGSQNIVVTIVPTGISFELDQIPDQTAVEDVDLILDLADYVALYTVNLDELEFEINSSYGEVKSSKLIFNYPNAFNYPGGRTSESVLLTVSNEGLVITSSFIINVQAVNDGPRLTVVKTPVMGLDDSVLDFRVKHFDEDGGENPFVELIITNTSNEMSYGSGDIHTDGGSYQVQMSLPAGKYTYYFRTNDLAEQANSINQTGPFSLKVLEYSETGDDSDGDSIPDAWELKHDLDPLDPDDAALDDDDDNYTNLQEYLGADGKPGGGDSSDPGDHLDIPAGLPADDGPDTDETDRSEKSSTTFFIILAVVIIFVILAVIFVLFLRKKKMPGIEEPAPPPPGAIMETQPAPAPAPPLPTPQVEEPPMETYAEPEPSAEPDAGEEEMEEE